MSDENVGYLDFDGKIARFTTARCSFDGRQLDVEAEGPQCKLHLYGIPFPNAATAAELPNQTYGPAEVEGDPIAEGGVEMRSMWLSFLHLAVKCGHYNVHEETLKVTLQADVCDVESGRSGVVDSVVRCTVEQALW